MQKEENEKPLFICFPPLDYPSTHQSSFLAKVWEKTQQHLPSRIFAEFSLDHTFGMGGTTNQIIQDILHFLTITQGGLILTPWHYSSRRRDGFPDTSRPWEIAWSSGICNNPLHLSSRQCVHSIFFSWFCCNCIYCFGDVHHWSNLEGRLLRYDFHADRKENTLIFWEEKIIAKNLPHSTVY